MKISKTQRVYKRDTSICNIQVSDILTVSVIVCSGVEMKDISVNKLGKVLFWFDKDQAKHIINLHRSNELVVKSRDLTDAILKVRRAIYERTKLGKGTSTAGVGI